MMFTHPDLMLDVAKQHHRELIDNARRFRLRHRRPTQALARPAPARVQDHEAENNVSPVGTLSVCEMPRELTAGRAR
jgi:hypothetical protein